jgi:hypothetical protein
MPLKLWEESISSVNPTHSVIMALAQGGERRVGRRAG